MIMMSDDRPVPDTGNFNMGNAEIPDNFLDDTLKKAVTQHSRKESQIASIEEDFAQHLDQNVATNLATNLIGYIGTNADHDSDEDDTRQNDDDVDNDEDKPTIDQVLIEAVHSHKHRKSRTDFVEKKLHELFPQSDDRQDLISSFAGGTDSGNPQTELDSNMAESGFGGYGTGAMDMSLIASNLVSFLHDDPLRSSQTTTPFGNEAEEPKKARGSTDLSIMQQQVDHLKAKLNNTQKELQTKNEENSLLTNRVEELEKQNEKLIKEIQYLQTSKTQLALKANTTIDQLRSYLLQYQKLMNGHKIVLN